VRNSPRYLLIVNFLNVFAFALWGPLYSVYATSHGAKLPVVGSLFAAFTLLDGCTILIFGRISKSEHAKATVVIGYLFQAVSALLFLTVHDPIGLIAPLSVFAIGSGMIAPNWKALYSGAVANERLSAQWSYYDAGNTFVIAAGSALAGILVGWQGYRAIFIGMFLVEIVAAAVAASIGRDGMSVRGPRGMPVGRERRSHQARNAPSAGRSRQRGRASSR
jgi:MFS family permease